MKFRYIGGVQDVAVVLPTRTLEVSSGELVELTDAEAAQLDDHPDWTADAGSAQGGDVDELDGLNKPELVARAEAAGLDTGGTRAALLERLRGAEITTTTTTQEG